MKERSIIFNSTQVRAILDKKQTQTRRVIRDQMDMEFDSADPFYGPYWLPYACDAGGEEAKVRCPYGKVGGRLWVKETWMQFPIELNPQIEDVWYKADENRRKPQVETKGIYQWRSPRHMPRWASRITLEITGVRVERLQNISGPDCWAEGIEEAGWDCERYGSVTECYRELWERINGIGSWDVNPWVWVLEFQKLTTDLIK